METKNEWSVNNRGDLWTLRITDDEGTESCMLTTEQISKLKLLLNTMHFPLPDNELPL